MAARVSLTGPGGSNSAFGRHWGWKAHLGLGRDERLCYSSCREGEGGLVTPQATKSRSLLNTAGRLRTIWEESEGLLVSAECVGVDPETLCFLWLWLWSYSCSQGIQIAEHVKGSHESRCWPRQRPWKNLYAQKHFLLHLLASWNSQHAIHSSGLRQHLQKPPSSRLTYNSLAIIVIIIAINNNSNQHLYTTCDFPGSFQCKILPTAHNRDIILFQRWGHRLRQTKRSA